jgi:hypothetical protein
MVCVVFEANEIREIFSIRVGPQRILTSFKMWLIELDFQMLALQLVRQTILKRVEVMASYCMCGVLD